MFEPGALAAAAAGRRSERRSGREICYIIDLLFFPRDECVSRPRPPLRLSVGLMAFPCFALFTCGKCSSDGWRGVVAISINEILFVIPRNHADLQGSTVIETLQRLCSASKLSF